VEVFDLPDRGPTAPGRQLGVGYAAQHLPHDPRHVTSDLLLHGASALGAAPRLEALDIELALTIDEAVHALRKSAAKPDWHLTTEPRLVGELSPSTFRILVREFSSR